MSDPRDLRIVSRGSGHGAGAPPPLEAQLGDKMQWLAHGDPETLRIIEKLVNRTIIRHRRRWRAPRLWIWVLVAGAFAWAC